jgi:hypothetical protein
MSFSTAAADALGRDPLLILPLEIFHRALLFIPTHIERLRRVSTGWRDAIENNWLSKQLLSHPALEMYILDKSMVKDAMNARKTLLELRLLTAKFIDPLDLIEAGLRASSEDNRHQNIQASINPSLLSFWSSVGSDREDVQEFLDYQLKGPVSLVACIEVTPFLAQYQAG